MSQFLNVLGGGAAGGSSGGSGNVTGPDSATDNAVVRFNGATGKVIQNSVVIMDDNGNITLPVTAVSGFTLFGTADQVTDTRSLSVGVDTGNQRFQIYSNRSGSLNAYSIDLAIIGNSNGQTHNYINRPDISGTPSSQWWISGNGNSLPATKPDGHFIFYCAGGQSLTQVTGRNIWMKYLPKYNQTTGDSANTDFEIVRVETALGSGEQNFAEFFAGSDGTTRVFAFGNTGILTKPGGTIPLVTTSSAITTGAAASLGTLANAPAAGNPTKWVPINDNGTTRYIPAW